jgi:hypothetical protein
MENELKNRREAGNPAEIEKNIDALVAEVSFRAYSIGKKFGLFDRIVDAKDVSNQDDNSADNTERKGAKQTITEDYSEVTALFRSVGRQIRDNPEKYLKMIPAEAKPVHYDAVADQIILEICPDIYKYKRKIA